MAAFYPTFRLDGKLLLAVDDRRMQAVHGPVKMRRICQALAIATGCA